MKALEFRRNVPRFAAARLAGSLTPGRGASVGPLRLADLEPPTAPGPDWVRVRPRLSGICGSDLTTIDGRSARYFEPLVSFPFVPGHEVVGDLDDGTRVVLEPVLGCVSRNLAPTCDPCSAGHLGNCEHTTFGDLEQGIQTGSCHDTGGGWATAFSAHPSQLHPVDGSFSDESAVMVEPTACAVHAALVADVPDGAIVTVLGAGTLGLLTIAALRTFAKPRTVVATARYPSQRRLAAELGADLVVEPDGIRRAVRRATGSRAV
ncbi:MAG: alcohol dehydrogenase catalytic domain-containing protein, partial [Acidimicrobiales bacterium]|nr:alcohol dehydrogenase catalytic domain-containing protein [Acidimicrobiales bacterium]